MGIRSTACHRRGDNDDDNNNDDNDNDTLRRCLTAMEAREYDVAGVARAL